MKDLKCDTLPCYECTLHESEYSQKDRIIEMVNLSLTFTIKLKPNTRNKMLYYCRYKQAIYNTFYEAETDLWNDFYDGLSKNPDDLNADGAMDLLERAFGKVGFVYNRSGHEK